MVLETTAAVTVSATRPGNGIDADFTGVVATLGIGGEGEGTLFLLCDQALAERLSRQMLGMAPEELDDATIADALGELVNQIGGTLGRTSRTSGETYTLTVPSVISGTGLRLTVLSTSQPLAVDLIIDGSVVHVRFCNRPAERHGKGTMAK